MLAVSDLEEDLYEPLCHLSLLSL
ncbi:hypothetical protein D041_2025A, partial [Vibrio parahaemolyticus EKP-008]